ncbi:hypothetical protein WISP_31720 [Willisornis vidua]|uniref:Uncharacterized protein n=1 Tax=Willisornis vidua TaxID=1566151 RepID=A0ABQ9DKM0_9PASS|nr:hypothetical protein WISP_31720 [Willisornis vidua]
MIELCAKIRGGSLELSGPNHVAPLTVEKQQSLCVLAPFPCEESSPVFNSWLKNGNFPDTQVPRMIELCTKIKGGSLGLSGAYDAAALPLEKQQSLSVLTPFPWEESSSVSNSGLKNGNFPDPHVPRMIELCAKIEGGSLGLSGANDAAPLILEKQQCLCVLAPFPWEESSSVLNSLMKHGNFPDLHVPRKFEFCSKRKGVSLSLSGADDRAPITLEKQQSLCVLAPFPWEESSSVFNSGLKNVHFPEPHMPRTIELCAKIKSGSIGISGANDAASLTLEKQESLSVLSPFLWEESSVLNSWLKTGYFPDPHVPRTIEISAKIRGGSFLLSGASDAAPLTLEKQQPLCILAPLSSRNLHPS